VNIGRLATAGVIVLGMLWIPFLQGIGKSGLYGYLQLVQSLLAPSIAAVFMAGIFSGRVTPKSGLVGLVFGFSLGMVRLFLQAGGDPELGGWQLPSLLQAFVDINWLYFSFMLFVATCIVIAVVSKFTPKASVEQLVGLTYSSVSAQHQEEDRRSWGFWEVFHTVVILGIITAIYVYFW
jgi:SSS family solute:Na+ symporter